MVEPYIGEISMVGFGFAPYGWALCNGQLLSITQNNALYALLGTTFGGDGRTTFGLPNLQGRLPVHVGQGPGLSLYEWGETAGTETNLITMSNLSNHTHSDAPGQQVHATMGASTTLPALTASGQMAATAGAGTTNTPSATMVLAQESVAVTTGTKAVNAYGVADAVTKFPVTVTSNYGSSQTEPLAGNVTISVPTITLGPTGGNIPVKNIQPVLAVYFVIALEGTFPTRG